jgi:hypothetical protein
MGAGLETSFVNRNEASGLSFHPGRAEINRVALKYL